MSLSATSSREITVDFTTANSTAIAGSDYQATSGTLTFTPGAASQTFTVPILGDTLDEPTEIFTVTLANPTNATLATAQATGTLVDDDMPPTLSIDTFMVPEGNSGTTPTTLTVSLSAASALTVTVDFTTANGTATAGSDYQAASGTLTFAPGTVSQTLLVPVLGDILDEANETFTVMLAIPPMPPWPQLRLPARLSIMMCPASRLAMLRCRRRQRHHISHLHRKPVRGECLNSLLSTFATSDGTATTGTDYQPRTGTLTFAPGHYTSSCSR